MALTNCTMLNETLSQEFQIDLAKYAGLAEMHWDCATEAVSCVIDAMAYVDDNTLIAYRLQQWFKNLRRIGTSSGSGEVYTVDVGTHHDLFALKSGTNLHHEAAISMLCLNPLRQYIPNFVYTYAIVNCSPPVVDREDEVISWCGSAKGRQIQLVMENLIKAKPMALFVAQCTGQQFLEVYVQVVNALDMAYHCCDFTHYDLHYNNVLVLPVAEKLAILYGDNEYINTTNLAKIIDFGYSHGIYNGENHGVKNLEVHGVQHNKSFPMHDCYKFLLFSAYKAQSQGNFALMPTLSKMFLFFSTESLGDRLRKYKKDKKDFFSLAIGSDQRSHSDILAFIRRTFPTDFITSKPDPDSVPSYCRTSCRSWSHTFSQILGTLQKPTTLVDFCSAMRGTQSIGDESRKEELQAWIGSINVEIMFSKELQEQSQNLETTDVRLGLFAPVPSREGGQQLLSYRVTLEIARYWLRSARCALTSQQAESRHKEELKTFETVLNNLWITYNRQRDKYLTAVEKDPPPDNIDALVLSI